MPMFGGVKGNAALPRVDETTDKLSAAPETPSKSRNRFGWGANRGGSTTAKDNRRGSTGKQRRPSAAAVAAAAALMGDLDEVDDPADLVAVVGNSSAASVLDSSTRSHQSATTTTTSTTTSKYLQYPQPPGVKSILKTTTFSSSLTNSMSSSEGSSSSIQLSALAEEVQPKQHPNTVSFDRIVVAEYAIMLGDAPYAEGAPIAMGPEKVGEATYHLEDYEDLRAMPSHQKKSTGSAGRTGLRLGPEQRSQILIGQGYTQSDIANANRKTLRSRTQLAKNLQQQQQQAGNNKTNAYNRVNAQAFAKAMKGFRKFAVGNKTGKDFADYPADGSLPPEFLAALEKTMMMTSDNSSTGDRSSDGYHYGDYDSDEDLVSVLSEIEANASRKKAAAQKQKVVATPGPPSSSKRLSRS